MRNIFPSGRNNDESASANRLAAAVSYVRRTSVQWRQPASLDESLYVSDVQEGLAAAHGTEHMLLQVKHSGHISGLSDGSGSV